MRPPEPSRTIVAPPRPAVAVVMPFAGTPAEAQASLAALDALRVRDRDVVVLADNSTTAQIAPAAGTGGVRVVRAPGEPSPSRARNAGAAAATGPDWLLFLDADTRPPPDLIAAFFATAIPDAVGALAGEVRALPGGDSVAARYGAARNFLDSGVHLSHPFAPRVAAANLLVRRAAFDAVGGFQEGIRAAEDTDFCWRLQDAGWELALAPAASVQHAYRPTLRGLRAQWRGYAAGRAWLARRYPGFTPEPGLFRAARRLAARRSAAPALDRPAPPGPARAAPLRAPVAAAIDGVLGVEELLGLALSNRPRRVEPCLPAETVLVAVRFPVSGTAPVPAAEPATGTIRVEAGARRAGPVAVPADPVTRVDYREDDGALERVAATARLALVRPCAVIGDRRAAGPSLWQLAPAALRLRRDRGARVGSIGGGGAERIADRLCALAGVPPP